MKPLSFYDFPRTTRRLQRQSITRRIYRNITTSTRMALRKVPDNLQRSQSEPCRHQERTEDRIRKNGMTPDFLRCRISLFLCFTDLSHEMDKPENRSPSCEYQYCFGEETSSSIGYLVPITQVLLLISGLCSLFFCSLRLVFRSLNLKRSRRSHHDRAQEKQEKHR